MPGKQVTTVGGGYRIPLGGLWEPVWDMDLGILLDERGSWGIYTPPTPAVIVQKQLPGVSSLALPAASLVLRS